MSGCGARKCAHTRLFAARGDCEARDSWHPARARSRSSGRLASDGVTHVATSGSTSSVVARGGGSMTPLIMLVAMLSVTVAAGAAAADAALSAESADPPSRRSIPRTQPLDDLYRRLPSVLSLTRVVAYLIAGATAWSVVEDMRAQRGVLLWALVALAVVFVVEAGSRMYGERNAAAALARLSPLLRGLDLLLAMLRVPIQNVERLFERLFPQRNPDPLERDEMAESFRRMVAEE